MKNNVTKYNNKKLPIPFIILGIVFEIMVSVSVVYGIIKVYKMPLTQFGPVWSDVMRIIILFFLIFILCLIIASFLGGLFGDLKGKIFISKEDKKIRDTNPYIYYRELPNNYGIGVTSLLFDSKIENYKDIVAVILDLCAKRYLLLIKGVDRYYIKILKGVDEKLLNNEKYILNLIISRNLKNINYSEWYSYCLQDGKDLGLYYHYDKPKKVINDGLVTRKEVERLKTVHRNISIFIGIFVFVIALIAGKVFESLLFALLALAASYVVLIIPFYVIFVSISVVNMGKLAKNVKYDVTLNNHLIRTNKGVIEFQKLISFQNFLSNFGNFVDKHPEEVVLWDRYLSYAQVFGLTNEIMKSGYNQLVKNSSFQIDSIDNISIYNIDYES